MVSRASGKAIGVSSLRLWNYEYIVDFRCRGVVM
jgi:hypothetical protein